MIARYRVQHTCLAGLADGAVVVDHVPRVCARVGGAGGAAPLEHAVGEGVGEGVRRHQPGAPVQEQEVLPATRLQIY